MQIGDTQKEEEKVVPKQVKQLFKIVYVDKDAEPKKTENVNQAKAIGGSCKWSKEDNLQFLDGTELQF